MKKRILSLLIISAMIAVFIPVINAEDKTDNEKVTLIVEVRGEAALETDEAVLMGAAEYNETDASEIQTEKILSVQENVQEDIKNKVNKKAEFGFTYTNVLNGFSVTVNKSDIDKIKALPNVENVYISKTHKRIEPVEPEEHAEIELFSNNDNTESASSIDHCCEMINVPYLHELGYKGQGQAIVVIDSELDVNHEFFASSIENPKYSKEDIAQIIKDKKLNVKVTANRVYRNEKIPFAYSYANNNADVYNTKLIHGTHVCGIAAGKNGTRKDGTKFSSVAPEAQIIFMGVMEGDNYYLPDNAIIAAIDDASKMDIAAINMSLVSDFTLFEGKQGTLFEKVINAAVNAGIEVCCGAGNAFSSAFYPEDIDYSASGLPAAVPASTGVAAAWSDDGKICGFSSWGTNTTLNLKPEITTPRGDIYSSVPDDEYATFDGTSMATPHMAGAAALMRQYIEENYQGKYENPAKFIENLTMTGAKIIIEDETEQIPYSPRNQGAGLLDLQAAATTPVILIGTEDKPKISLKDKLTDTFKVEFTAKNFTDTAVTYDTIKTSVFTDEHYYSEYVGCILLAEWLKKLNFTVADIPRSVTVPANGEAKISFTIELDSEQTSENLEILTNGFYLDGFVELSDSNNAVPTISIPYTGFYGDWTAAPAFDKPYYQNERYDDTFLGSDSGKCVCSNTSSKSCKYLGKNQLLEDILGNSTTLRKEMQDYLEYESESYAGISPNGDGNFDFLCVNVYPNRAMENCKVRIENSNGEIMNVIGEAGDNGGFAVVSSNNEPLDKYDKFLVNCTDYNDLSSLPDGDYTVYVTGRLAYEGSKDEEISMKFYVDTVAPEITKKEIRKEDNKTYLDLSISDDRYVMGAMVNGKKTNGTNFEKPMYIKASKTGECSIDITGTDVSTLTITAFDYAYNTTECNVIDEPTPSPSVTPTVAPTPSISPSPTPSSSVTPTLPPKTGDRVEFKRIDNVISAKLIFEETTPPTENNIWLIVAYKDNGELKRVEMPQITDMTSGFVIPQKYKDCDIIVYVWDRNMKPLMEVQEVDV